MGGDMDQMQSDKTLSVNLERAGVSIARSLFVLKKEKTRYE